MLKVERIEDIRGFEQISDEWRELLKASCVDRLFLSWEWMFTWWKHLAGNRVMYLLTVRNAEKLLAIAPLALRSWQPRRLLPFRMLEFMASDTVGADYLDLIVHSGAETEAIQALCEYLSDNKMILELSRIDANRSSIDSLAGRLRKLGWATTRHTIDVCPYIDISGYDWETYLSCVGSSHRYNIRRRIRNLEKHFSVDVEMVADELQRKNCFRELIKLHHKRRGGPKRSDAFYNNALIEFHDELSRIALQYGWLRLTLLRLNGRPAASLYGFSCQRKFYFYQSGFDPNYGKYSVGLISLAMSIRSAIEEGIDTYDLLHGDEAYKFRWAHRQRQLVRLHLFPPRASGMLCRHLMAFRQSIRKAIPNRMFT
jgi:CelD/BcsL family acetyltransferase involved in cellulose biosynthesis